MALPTSDEKQGNPPAQEQGAEVKQPDYVTREELAKFHDQLKDTLAEWYRGVQSQTDRYQARVQERLAEFEKGIAALRAAGINVSDEQIAAAKRNLALEELTSANKPNEGAQQQAVAEPEEADAILEAFRDTVTSAAERLMRAAGVTLEDDDPEVAQYIEPKSEGTVEEYLDAILQAINAKKERIAKGPALGQMPSLTHGGTPAANPIQNITDPAELWREAVRQGRIR